jgi:hypothetical protein
MGFAFFWQIERKDSTASNKLEISNLNWQLFAKPKMS